VATKAKYASRCTFIKPAHARDPHQTRVTVTLTISPDCWVGPAAGTMRCMLSLLLQILSERDQICASQKREAGPMQKFGAILTSALVLFAVADAAAARTHTQNISNSIAEAFCAKHGGGTECTFCDPKHCHVISCSNQTGSRCTNDVVDKIVAKPGRTRKPVAGVDGVGGSKPIKHPIKVGTSHPPTSVKSSVTTTSFHSGGMNQGSHRR
jgi:hypothetical protein